MCRKLSFLIIFLLLTIYSSIGIKSNEINNDIISIEFKGEVENNKVIKTKRGKTINDVLDEIELTEDSDLSNISLNSKLYNNQIIVVPSKQNNIKSISISNASLEELITLPGIGEKTAANIITYRNKYGFNSLEDIKNVKGIGDKKYNSIKEYICL